MRKFIRGSLVEIGKSMLWTEKGVRGALEKHLLFPGTQNIRTHKCTINFLHSLQASGSITQHKTSIRLYYLKIQESCSELILLMGET